MARPPNFDRVLNDVHTYGINIKTREIYLHAFYASNDDEPGVEYRIATSFIKNLHILDAQNHENILIHMHIVGGNWADGMSLFNAIRAAKSHITILAYAQAESMSGIIFQAADKRVMMPDAYLMLHYGSLGMDSNTLAVKSYVEFSKVGDDRMVSILAEKMMKSPSFKGYDFKKTFNFVDKIMKEKGDWYLTAEQAREYHLSDGTLGQRGFEDYNAIRKA